MLSTNIKQNKPVSNDINSTISYESMYFPQFTPKNKWSVTNPRHPSAEHQMPHDHHTATVEAPNNIAAATNAHCKPTLPI